jgi:hypothetical protein
LLHHNTILANVKSFSNSPTVLKLKFEFLASVNI